MQSIPVKLFQTADVITVAAPMPGLGAEDISVEVTPEGRLILYGALRGMLKDEKQILLDEFDFGPYHRELELPAPVDGDRATVTYGNGILVVALPIAPETRPARLTLEETGPARAARLGAPDQVVHPIRTEQEKQS